MSVAKKTEMCVCVYVCAYEVPIDGGVAKPYTEGALQTSWMLHEASIERRICKAPRGFVHTNIPRHAHFSLFPTHKGGASLWRLCKALYTRGSVKQL